MAAIQSVRRARRPRGKRNLVTVDEAITDRAQRLDRSRSTVYRELAAQVADVDLDHVSTRVEVVAPDGAQDLLLGEHLPRVPHEVCEQLELPGRQGDRQLVPLHAAGEEVQTDVADRQLGGATLLWTA